jgi:hypothetical protein
MNKEFIRMQKLAGLMTEGLYTSDEKAPMEGMSTGKMTKKELKAKIKEMMTPSPDEDIDDNYDDSMDVYDDQYPEMAEGTIGQEAYAEMGSMDEAASDDIADVAPRSHIGSLVRAAEGIIGALKDGGFSEDDIYEFIISKIKTLSVDESLFEAKKDEEADTEDVIVADTEEVPAEGGEDAAVDVTADDTQVDVNMDGVPDVDTGSAESKKAFTSLVDTYNASKELGDPKLTQMIANALTYYNKNIILKTGQPQA